MARIRTIKPEFWTSLSVNSLSVHARLTFIGLWNYCDDYGRGRDEARLVRAAVWPLDAFATPSRVETWLAEIADAGLIVRYEVEGRRYLWVSGWEEHQSAAYRRGDPQHPAPPDVPAAPPDVPLARQDVQTARQVVLEQGTGNREVEQGTGIAPKAARPTDPLWDALVTCYGEPPTTSRFRGAWNAALADIRGQADATPEEIIRRFRVGKAGSDDWQVATPAALAKYWGQLGKPSLNGSAGTRELARQLREAGQ